MGKTAFITGVNGQDGSYLVPFLLSKGYDVHGLVRRTSQFNRTRIEKTRDDARQQGKVFELHYGDMGDAGSLHRIIEKARPDEIYNLASQSHVHVSNNEPEYTSEINGIGVLRLLEGIRYTNLNCRLYQASSSELFGKPEEVPQTEKTPFHPRSAYGVAKLYGHWMVRHYREQYGIHASNGILFNHESPRRGENFVTRKITYSLARIRAGQQERLSLGNLDAQRDWGYAKEYVEAMWCMLQQDEPDDYVIATGETHTVREFVEKAADVSGYSLEWEGEGIEEKGLDKKTGKIIVDINPKYYREKEEHLLVGNPAYARERLGWTPRTQFSELVEIMMRADIDKLSK